MMRRFRTATALIVLSLSACWVTIGPLGLDEDADAGQNIIHRGDGGFLAEFCGNGILETGEACDDGNLSQEDDCLSNCSLARCGDGFVQDGVEDCDEESERCTEDCQWVSDGSGDGGTYERAGLSCLTIHQLYPDLPTGKYWIKPGEEAWRVNCEMDFDGGGWTRVVRVVSNAFLWDAWSMRQSGAESFGIPISSLSRCCNGEDLSYAFKVDNEFQDQRYQSVMGAAFDPSQPAGNFDSNNGVMVSPAVGEDYAHCPAALTRQNDWWNWSIAQARWDGCAGYGADGFLIAGEAGREEQATKLFGFGQYYGDSFSSIEVLVRESPR